MSESENIEVLDYRPLANLLGKRTNLLKKREKLKDLGLKLKAELADLSRKMNPMDLNSAGTVFLHKTRLEVLPGKIAEIDEEIKVIDEEIEKESQSMDELLSSLYAQDYDKLLFAASKAILPWCETEPEARSIVETLPRVAKFISAVKTVLSTTGAEKARLGLRFLERKCMKGSLLPNDLLALLPPAVEIKKL